MLKLRFIATEVGVPEYDESENSLADVLDEPEVTEDYIKEFEYDEDFPDEALDACSDFGACYLSASKCYIETRPKGIWLHNESDMDMYGTIEERSVHFVDGDIEEWKAILRKAR